MIGKLRAPFTSRYVDGAESSLEQAEPTDITLVHRLLHIALGGFAVCSRPSCSYSPPPFSHRFGRRFCCRTFFRSRSDFGVTSTISSSAMN